MHGQRARQLLQPGEQVQLQHHLVLGYLGLSEGLRFLCLIWLVVVGGGWLVGWLVGGEEGGREGERE